MKATTGIALLASAGFTNAATLGRPAASPRAAETSQQLCALGSVDENGNYFCQAVSQIVYTNVGTSGASYEDVVSMDSQTGTCQKQAKSISGGLAPFDEPVSLHWRGPVNIKQIAVYLPGSTDSKRGAIDEVVEKRHSHNHARKHARKHARFQHSHLHSEREEGPNKVEEKRQHPTIWVTATIDGAVVSWINNYWGPADSATPAPAAAPANTEAYAPVASAPATSTPAPAVTAEATQTAVAGIQADGYIQPSSSSAAAANPSTTPAAAASSSASTAAAEPSTSTVAASGGDYVRTAYYDSDSGTASGLVFLANYGGQGSGAWSSTFGNTLSYVDSTGTTGAASAQVLSNTTIPSAKEVAIFSDEACDESCGYVQPGSVAYKGFGQGDKAFLVEFQMPHESTTEGGAQADMPAFWALNSKIPRTQQYGGCSCWATGCGEFDFFETLAVGDTKCKSTVHAVNSGGDSNYFDRPVETSIKAAVVFNSASQSVSIKVLDDSTVFGDSLTAEDIAGFLSTNDDVEISGSLGASLFAIAS